MSPQHAAFNVLDHDPFAKFREQESDSPPAPLKPIGSVGQIKKAYREREKAEEKEQQRRHAKHVVKIAQNVSNATTAVYNDHMVILMRMEINYQKRENVLALAAAGRDQGVVALWSLGALQ